MRQCVQEGRCSRGFALTSIIPFSWRKGKTPFERFCALDFRTDVRSSQYRGALSIVRVVRSSASLAEPVTNGNGYGDDNSHDEIGPEIHLHQETRSHRHNEKTQMAPLAR